HTHNQISKYAGLFAAHPLEIAGVNNITILERESRVGGRVHTHYFDDYTKQNKLYAELGAMRLPHVEKNGKPLGEHALVFELIEHLNNLNKSHPERKIDLIPFIFSSDNDKFFYNGERLTQKDAQEVKNFHLLGFPPSVRPSSIMLFSEALKPFFKRLDENFDDGVKYLKKYDRHSVYSYMKEVFLPEKLLLTDLMYPPPNADEIIGAMELTESATGLFRLAFVEAVLDAYTFTNSYPGEDVKRTWKTIDGGMQRLPDALCSVLKQRIKLNSKVYKLEHLENGNVKVYWKGQPPSSEEFHRVIVTAPLGVVRQWDLPKLSYGKRRAIRELNYDNSAKIFLRFKSRFWEKDDRMVGGSSSTDLMIRTVVYPSYYTDISPDNDAMLLASYTWANDAAKFAPLTQDECFKYALRDLETLHNRSLKNEWIPGTDNNVSIYWTNQKSTVGAFALFGPEQLVNLLPDMLKVEKSIHWAGEHTDIHHAWIVGALNSAVRVVQEVLIAESREKDWTVLKNHELLRSWMGNDS
ncbi:1418_t:CDS:2, partial [Paraglomus occultum]